MADVAPKIIVLAFGVGALGFPDALRLMLDAAGRSPLVDIGICVLAMGMATANVFATVLLARFVRDRDRDARALAGARGAAPPAADLFAQMTLVVSLAVALPVSVCLLAASGGGAVAVALRRLAADFAWKSHVAEVVVAIAAAAAASLSCGRPLLRVFHAVDSARGGAERFANMTRAVGSLAGLFPGCAGFLVVACAVSGALWAQRCPLASVFVGVAAAAAAVLVGRFPCFARDAAGTGGGAVAVPAPAPAADAPRFGKLTQATFLAGVSFLVFVLGTTYVPVERESDGSKYPWFV